MLFRSAVFLQRTGGFYLHRPQRDDASAAADEGGWADPNGKKEDLFNRRFFAPDGRCGKNLNFLRAFPSDLGAIYCFFVHDRFTKRHYNLNRFAKKSGRSDFRERKEREWTSFPAAAAKGFDE